MKQPTVFFPSLRNVFSLAPLVCLLLIAAACGQSPDNAESPAPIVVTQVYIVTGEEVVVTRLVEPDITPSPPPTPPPAGPPPPVTLDIAFIRDTAPPVDPQQTVDQDGIDLIENIFVGLTRYDRQTDQIEPVLASSWDVSRDGRVWTFYLRDDIFWVKSGQARSPKSLPGVETVRPVTARDLVFAVQRACRQTPNTPDAFMLFIIEGCEHVNDLPQPTPADLDNISVKALNDLTLQVTLTKPSAHFLTLTSLWFMRPLPPELIETYGDEWQSDPDLGELWTSGPFFPHTPQFRTLQRNPNWPLPRDAEANVDVVNIQYLEDSEAAFSAWQNKQIDVMNATPLNAEELPENIAARLVQVPQQTLYYLGFNFDSGVFREPEVRRAFSAAIDRERLVEELLEGQAFPMRHLLPPGVIATLPINEVGVGYSPDYADQQMAASGFKSCQLMPPITFLVSSSDFSLQQAELIRRMWIEELDCTEAQINIEQVQFGTLLANTRPNAGAVRPDVWELAWASYYPDAHNWQGDLLHCEDSENRRNRPCSEVDDLIRQAGSTMAPAERAALYRQIENLFFNENGIMPIAPLYVRSAPALVQVWLTYTPMLFGGEQYDAYVIDVERKELERTRSEP